MHDFKKAIKEWEWLSENVDDPLINECCGQFHVDFEDTILFSLKLADMVMDIIPDHILKAVGTMDNYEGTMNSADADHREWFWDVIQAFEKQIIQGKP